MIVFMRDGLFTKVDVPMNAKVPFLPVDIACDMLIDTVINAEAMKTNLFICNLTWQRLLFLISDHFTIHSVKRAFSDPEIYVKEVSNKPNVRDQNYLNQD